MKILVGPRTSKTTELIFHPDWIYAQIILPADFLACGLYYKLMTIVNADPRVEASLTDDARVVIYDCHMFIVQATGWFSM